MNRRAFNAADIDKPCVCRGFRVKPSAIRKKRATGIEPATFSLGSCRPISQAAENSGTYDEYAAVPSSSASSSMAGASEEGQPAGTEPEPPRTKRRAPKPRPTFITQNTAYKLIDAAPSAEWRLLIALARFGGLHVPREALALRWGDVDWERSRLLVRARGGAGESRSERVVPLFPEVRIHLQTVFDAAPAGDERVLVSLRESANLSIVLRRLVRRAGLMPWARPWATLRASRREELSWRFPVYAVSAWLGGARPFATGPDLQVTEADWKRAIETDTRWDGATQPTVSPEPSTASIWTRELVGGARPASADSGLADLLRAWTSLPDAVRADIEALMRRS